MPARPVPVVPIPYHEPGHPSKAAGYSTQVDQVSAAGVRESVTVTGLDALLADGVIDDPLAGNYRLVDLDQILVGMDTPDLPGSFETYSVISGTVQNNVEKMPGTRREVKSIVGSNGQYLSVAAGDVNGDGLDEQIAAWLGWGNTVKLSIGELPTLPGKTTSLPAAAARPASGGYALQFNGIDTYVTTMPIIDLGDSNSMAIDAWVKPTDITTNPYYTIVRQQGGSWPDWLLAFQDHGTTLSFGLLAGESYEELDVPITPERFTDGRWHRVLATYDGAHQRMYVDGRLFGSRAKSGNIVNNGGDHSIGSANGTEVFNGQIDQVSIWDRAPNAADQGLVARWSFEEGTGTTTVDDMGTYTGTLTSDAMSVPGNAPAGPIHLLARGYDQALWHGICDADGGACHWSNAGGILASGPAVSSRGGGSVLRAAACT